MGKLVDLTDSKFNRLLVLNRADNDKSNNTMWFCRCDCGNTSTVNGGSLKDGHTKSCGCLSRELIAKKQFKHGQVGTPEYSVWESMKSRCSNVPSEQQKNK